MNETQFQSIIEDITETKTLVKNLVEDHKEDKQERLLREATVDIRLRTIEIKIEDAVVTWKIVKWIGTSIIALLLAAITFDWHAVSINWHMLIGK